MASRNLPEAILSCVGVSLLLVKAAGAPIKNILAGIQDFGGASGAGATFAEEERTTGLANITSAM